ncbi:DUF2207 domain-containing protein [Ruania halotolerans]|uniref:DUF2207 domain-containing protein n=1 Tax=Ruania halotolerans TaxID=2897773 RepID=UPI001E40BB29|nr:DUF2207 domain-containing protein [Ruania halotolerans]UFU05429.1 DUF2207 domain-containing protein [Ruania halotolerans]
MRRPILLGRLFPFLAVAVIAALALLGSPTAAQADAEDAWSIEQYHVNAEVHPEGTIEVTIDMTFDFADEPGHGPFLTLVERQEIPDDPDHYRVLEYSGITASSDSGAPADVHTESDDGGLIVYVGDENEEVSGAQQYTISYTVAGVPNSGAGTHGQDEVFWNVIGSAWEVPMSDVLVEIDGPHAIRDAACYVGPVGSGDICANATYRSDGLASFDEPSLDSGEGMTIVLAYEPDTFGGVEPILVERTTWSNFFGADTLAPWLALLLGGGGIAAVAVRARQRGRDRAHLGLTPGLRPVDGVDSTAVGPAGKGPVAVRFTPPDGVTPGAAGTLLDEVAHTHDVTATIVDLAVRGYLTIEEVPTEETDDGSPDWRLRRTLTGPQASWDGLLAFEETILRGIFPGSDPQVRMSELSTEFAKSLGQAQSELYDRVVERGWFSTSPQQVRYAWAGAGVLIVLAGIGATIALGMLTGWGFLGLAVVLIGIATLVAAPFAPARTADGTAVLAQTLGFKKYLETAEANQLRFEEGEDIFSRYLPFAIAFGVAQHWADVFAEAAAAGQVELQPTWYVGTTPGLWTAAAFSGVSTFASTASVSVGAAVSGAGGGSGFAGGSVGGGVGGGGGGGW